MSTREVRTKNGKKRISQEVKMEIVREYYLEGQHNQSALARKYGIGMVTVHDILRNFAAENDKSALLMGKKVKTSESEEIKALRKEVWDLKKQLDETLIHHSDRGTQYASSDYINVLSGSHITPSMTENGNPKDNAMAERPHSSIDWHTPDEAHGMCGDMKRHWHSWREDAIRNLQNVAML